MLHPLDHAGPEAQKQSRGAEAGGCRGNPQQAGGDPVPGDHGEAS